MFSLTSMDFLLESSASRIFFSDRVQYTSWTLVIGECLVKFLGLERTLI